MKLENEIIQEQQTENFNNQMMNEEVVQNTSTESESIVEDNSVNEIEKSFAQEACSLKLGQPWLHQAFYSRCLFVCLFVCLNVNIYVV